MKGKAIRCLLDVLDLPESIYLLPTDGRKSKDLCRQRKKLAIFLASRSNPDGTSIKVSPDTAAAKSGLKLRVVKYRMKDLRTLGFLEDEGKIDGYFHTLIRSLNVSKMRAAAGVQDSPDRVQDTNDRVQDTNDRVQDRPYLAHNRPALPPNQPPPPPTPVQKANGLSKGGGWEEDFFLLDHIFTQMGAMTTSARSRLEPLAEQFGFPVLKLAIARWLTFKGGTDGMKSPWLVFLAESEGWMAKAQQISLTDSEWRKENVPGAHEAQEASIERQTQELVKKRDESPGWGDIQNEVGIEEFLDK